METVMEPVGLGALSPEHHEELSRAGLRAVPIGFGLAPEHREELARAGLTLVPAPRPRPIQGLGAHPSVQPVQTLSVLSSLGAQVAAPGSVPTCGGPYGSLRVIAAPGDSAGNPPPEVGGIGQPPVNGLPPAAIGQILAAFVADSGGKNSAVVGGNAPLANGLIFFYNGVRYFVSWRYYPSGNMYPLLFTCVPGPGYAVATSAGATTATTTDYTWLYVLLGVAVVGGVLYVALD